MLNRRNFLRLAAGTTAAHSLPALPEIPNHPVPNSLSLGSRSTKWGSGYFGEWIADSQGLPAYRYLCDQARDPKARTPVETAWRSETDQTHQVGNDRIVAAVSNYGYIQVRQDEGAPKFLNDYHPEQGFFGAGLGYLTDGKTVLATYYPGSNSGEVKSFERHFGMGYYRKTVSSDAFSADHLIFAPFGDDPVLLSQVTIKNHSATPTTLTWAEYWGCQMYQFSYRSYMEGYDLSAGDIGGGSQVDPQRVTRLRREFAQRFSHRVTPIAAHNGLIEYKEFQGRSPEEEQLWEALRKRQTADPETFLGPPVADLSGHLEMDDLHPPATFLCSLDELRTTWSSDAKEFFGQGGVLRPDGVLQEISRVATGPETALISKKHLTLAAGEERTLYCIYGYLPEGFSADSLIAKYRSQPERHFIASCGQWKRSGIHFDVKDQPWVARETAWHNYYLRSGFTYDDFFKEHIVSQGQVYQYVMGFQGAPRDPLQHALPMIFDDATLAKEVLRYTLKSQQPNGALPYAIVGHGVPMPSFWLPSDLDLWLLWTASEYVLATRDKDFLEEEIAVYPLADNGPRAKVGSLLERSYRHLKDVIGTGTHGLIKGHNDDWNDEIYWRGIPENLRSEVRRESESTMNAAMASYILDHYAAMLRFIGNQELTAEAAAFADRQRMAVRAQWADGWFKRLYLGPTLGWLGEDRMWLETQPWAIVGGAATPAQQKALVAAMDELLRRPSPIGAKQVSKIVEWPGVVPGETENGGVWAALDGPLIWALARVDGAMAWEEWIKNTRARHAETYPNVWYGIWSGTDVFDSVDSPHAGETGYDYGLVDPEARGKPSTYRGLSWTAWPVMCMHRHAWPLYSAAKLMGIEFTSRGLDLAPVIPERVWSFESKLLGLRRSATGYEGWYQPQVAGHWLVHFRIPADDSSRYQVLVNGRAVDSSRAERNVLEFSGDSTGDAALRWKIARV